MEQIKDVSVLDKELDLKDKKILEQLFINARTPFSIIARTVGLSKESVNYRVNRLQELGIVTGFNTIIDVKQIKYLMFFTYLKFRNIDVEKEKEIINHITSHPNVSWLVKVVGNYDVVIKLFAKNNNEVDNIIKEIESKYKIYFDDYKTDSLTEEHAIPFSFMFPKGKKREIYNLMLKDNKNELDKTDLSILKILSHNARIQTTDIAKTLKLSRDLIKYRLKKLEKDKIIINYRPDVWPKKFGYNWYFVILKLSRLTDEKSKQLKSFLVNHPNVTYYYKTIGSSDIQIEFRIKTAIELNNILMELRSIVKDVLKSHEVLTIINEYKYTYFPDCLLKQE